MLQQLLARAAQLGVRTGNRGLLRALGLAHRHAELVHRHELHPSRLELLRGRQRGRVRGGEGFLSGRDRCLAEQTTAYRVELPPRASDRGFLSGHRGGRSRLPFGLLSGRLVVWHSLARQPLETGQHLVQ
ncbi:hypothetical protein BAY60_35760 (plasmid) [Prauserella muralis]|uniref:Uncharacterized protein n=1 Tax=Prauserella muralis TaxID=588067 RepID=A0A2V4ABU3_9PSEU|nr:hypothetical protein BAY60_35760 [Prauserella muralis]TWE11204.1 hypothetical protein FHX69_7423 [Prauserella muralis]